eukprot:gene8508-9421_t
MPRKRKNKVKFVKQAVAEREEDSLEDTEMHDEVPYQADDQCLIDSDADAQGGSRWQLPVTFKKSVQSISLEDNGWTIDVEKSLVEPVWLTGEQIPSTIAVSSALSSENEETGQPAPPAPKRRRTRKTRAATSTRERTAKYSDSEEEPGIEISAESKELDYIFFGDSLSSDSDLESDEFDWIS